MLIGLHGKKQAGKDTVYERLARNRASWGIPVERASFADLLYESAAAALGVDVETLRRIKSAPDAMVELYDTDGVAMLSRLTVREFLQNYGTQAHRNVFGTDFWVEQVDLADHHRKIVCVTDVRFANEAQAVSDAGGAVVHVVGPPEIEEAGDGHASEEPLPGYLIDHYISNAVRDDGFRSLDSQVLEMVLNLLREERGR